MGYRSSLWLDRSERREITSRLRPNTNVILSSMFPSVSAVMTLVFAADNRFVWRWLRAPRQSYIERVFRPRVRRNATRFFSITLRIFRPRLSCKVDGEQWSSDRYSDCAVADYPTMRISRSIVTQTVAPCRCRLKSPDPARLAPRSCAPRTSCGYPQYPRPA